MKKDFKINPVGLKGNEINERMRQLMGIAPINENVSRSVVELTKMGPDGKAYAIVRENHEYFIKVSDKTSKLVTEDFKYIGGLQNKKQEAYPSYAKATKHLNLTFKSLAEAYGTDSNINVFEDDDLLNEENFATKHIVDKDGTALKQDAKEGSEEDGFGDNVATGKTMKEFEKVKLSEGMAGFSEMRGNGFTNEGNLEENDPMWEDEMSDEERAIDEMIAASKADECWMGEEENVDYTMGSNDPNQLPNPAPELHIPTEGYMEEDMYEEGMYEEELHGNQDKIDMNHNGKIDGDDFAMLRRGKGVEEELHGNQDKIDMNHNGKIDGDDLSMLRNMNEEGDMSNDELMDRLDNMSATELLQLLGDAGRDLKSVISQKLATGMGKARDYFNRQYPDVNEALTLEEIKEAIADLKKKL